MPEIKNLNKVAKRILKAIRNKEKILIFADADPDGISSAIILKETLRNLGKEIPDEAIYFPDREREGYGLNEKALNYLKTKAPALLFLLDCGIGNFKEILEAKKIGFEVIVIDHHEILGKLPEASIVVDPKQKGDDYPFKGLATAAILYKLAEVLLGKNFGGELGNSFLELVAIATLADMMPKKDENIIFIEEGIASLKKSFRPGLNVFFEIEEVKNQDIQKTISKIIAALNSGRTKNHLQESYFLLTTSKKENAKELAKKLISQSTLRKEKIEEIKNELVEKLKKKNSLPIIFEGRADWPIVLMGPVASKICQIFQKPTFIFAKKKKESVGAVRVPPEFNSVKIMERCSQYLKTYGGHPLAAGFTISNENLKKFRDCLIKFFENNEKNNYLC